MFRYGLLKERMAALITDGLRASLLEQQGYEVQVLEFIDMEHTPKNILIRAVKKSGGNYPVIRPASSGEKPREKETLAREAELERCMDFLKADPALYRLLKHGAS